MKSILCLTLTIVCSSSFNRHNGVQAFVVPVRIPAAVLEASPFELNLRQATTTVALGAKEGGFGKTTAAASGGFAKTAKKKKTSASTYKLEENGCIQDYLSPRLFEDPAILQDVGQKLRAGEIVVIRNAYKPEFAEAMYQELYETTAWSKNEDYCNDGYHFRHYNVYDKKDYSELFQQTLQLFDSDETKKFATDLTGRDCTGDAVGSPSMYGSGDHSLPHTDHIGQRTIAYVWHLSKNWKPEWGGGLYWAQEPLANAYLHASFNTLVLFSVTPHSAHFVTTVSPHAKEKRLAFNGWWQSSLIPTANDNLEEMLSTPEQRQTLTHAQLLAITDMLDDPWMPQIQPPERREKIEAIRLQIMSESYPPVRSMPVV